MTKKARILMGGCWLICVVLLIAASAWANFRWDDLQATRLVKEQDWLELRLEVLGLRLSYPAYRIHLELDGGNAIAFTFLASSGMAEHLTKEDGKVEAEEMMGYHAQGIRDQVEKLLKDEFPSLWATYDSQEDFHGTFLGPGEKWDDPPLSIGTWKGERLYWDR